MEVTDKSKLPALAELVALAENNVLSEELADMPVKLSVFVSA